ncbi:MAG: hypothetical protein RLT05_10615, partial [Bauldia litoralis]
MTISRDVLFVGSLPAEDTAGCLDALGAALGDVLKRVPDGETGARSKFITWQAPVIGGAEQFEMGELGPQSEWGPNGELPPRIIRLKPGATGRPNFGPTGYADAAIESFRVFKEAKAAGRFAKEARFQVGLPTPLGVIALFLEPDGQAVAEPPYAERMQADVDRICREIPAEDLTVQWDVPTEIAIWEGHTDTFLDGDKEGCVERLVALMERVPAAAEVGMHLCYGDVSHQHWKEPDLALMAEFTNTVTARLTRRLDYVHMPILRDWKDADDYAGLERFDLPAETQVFLGLLHMTDGVEGAKARIAAAREHLGSFGVRSE